MPAYDDMQLYSRLPNKRKVQNDHIQLEFSFEIAPIPKKQEKWPPKAASVNKYLSLCLIGNKVQ